MDSFRNGPQLTDQSAGLIIVIVMYVSAVLTVLIMEGWLSQAFINLGIVTAIVLAFMTALFIISRLVKRTDVVDAAWGPAFIVAAVSSFILGGQSIGVNVQTLTTGLVIIWGARLSFSIIRRLLGQNEDRRYIELRKSWRGNVALNTYFRVFVIQALLASIISIALIYANFAPTKALSGSLVHGGVALWLIGFFFQVIGDGQLQSFLAKKENKGKLMTEGLWSYTRHPNYFGEAAMWWGISLIILSLPHGLAGIITPIVITYLLYYVSGVPLAEASTSKKPGWKSYEKRVSKFIPMAPKE